MKLKNLLLFGLIFLFVASCGKKEVNIKIGVILSLSGNGAQYGKMIIDGMNLAIKLSNENNEQKFNLIVEDDKTEPRDGVSAARKLINVDKVNIILGPIASSVALAVAPICQDNKVIMISPAASTPKLSNAGDFIFRIYPSDDYDGSFLADFSFNKLITNRASIIYLNNDFGVGLQNKFSEKYNELGGKILTTEPFPQGSSDFRNQLQKIKRDDSQVLFIIATVKEYATILRQMKELKINRKIVAPVTFDDPQIIDLAGNTAEGVYYSRPFFDPNSKDDAVKMFISEFEREYGTEPSILHALGFDAIKLIVDQIKKNGLDTEKIKSSLYELRDFPGASGKISFDENGDVIKELQIMVIKNLRAEQF